MTVRMTPAQARALQQKGSSAATDVDGRPTKKKARTTVPMKDCAPNRCVACGYVTKSETDEARHNRDTGHLRFESLAVTVTAEEPDDTAGVE